MQLVKLNTAVCQRRKLQLEILVKRNVSKKVPYSSRTKFIWRYQGYSIRTLISPEFWWILLKWITGCVQTGNAVFDMNSPKFMWILTVFEFFSLHLNSLARPKFSRCFSTQKILLNFTEFCPQFSAKFSKIHLNSPKNCPYGMALKDPKMHVRKKDLFSFVHPKIGR